MKSIHEILLAFVCALVVLSGCATTATPARSRAEIAQAHAYETAHQNDSDLFDGYERAAITSHTKRMDAELKADSAGLQNEVRANPAKWINPSDVSAEQIRLQALHDKKITDYAAALANYRALKQKNEEINIKTARQIGAALNPPAPLAPVNLSTQIQGATGTAPVAPIVNP